MGPPASLPLPKLRSGAFKRLAPAVVLALAAAACGSGPAPTTYDLSAPRAGARFGGAVSGQIVVSEPTAIQTLEAEKIIAKDKAVSRPGERVTPDYLLNTEIRAFQISSATGEAVVELSGRLVQDRTGRIVAGRVFSAREPVAKVDAASAAQALDAALSRVLIEMVRWVGSGR